MRRDDAQGEWRMCCRVSDDVLEYSEASHTGSGRGVGSSRKKFQWGVASGARCE